MTRSRLLGKGTYGLESVHDVELATLSWVTWFNSVRHHGTLNAVPPTEYVIAKYVHQNWLFGFERGCAGINRQGVGDGGALHLRGSVPRWPRVMRWRS